MTRIVLFSWDEKHPAFSTRSEIVIFPAALNALSPPPTESAVVPDWTWRDQIKPEPRARTTGLLQPDEAEKLILDSLSQS